ncbi:MAG TPA: hypothetical protein VE646_10345 [Actinomycetota bacterium]|nr:hypothetical protein [Actinomycetota bacterium]
MWSPTVEQFEEHYQLSCRRCGHRWPLVYTVRRQMEPDGDSQEVYFRRGLPASSPWAGRPCPRCADQRVDVRMTHRRPLPPLRSAG